MKSRRCSHEHDNGRSAWFVIGEWLIGQYRVIAQRCDSCKRERRSYAGNGDEARLSGRNGIRKVNV